MKLRMIREGKGREGKPLERRDRDSTSLLYSRTQAPFSRSKSRAVSEVLNLRMHFDGFDA
jgi:hypothetical protein